MRRPLLALLLFTLLAVPAPGQLTLVQTIPIEGEPVALALTDNATRISTPAADGILLTLAGRSEEKSPIRGATAIAMSPDESRTYAGLRTGEVLALNESGIQEWSRQTGAPVTSLSITAQNQVFYTAGDTVGLLGPDGAELRKQKFPDLAAGAISPGAGMALAAQGNTVLGLDAALQTKWQAPLSAAVADLKASDTLGAALTTDGGLYRIDPGGRTTKTRVEPGHGLVAVSPDGSRIAAAARGQVLLFDGELREISKQGVPDPAAIAFTPEGNFLAVASRDKHIYLFALTNRYPATPIRIESEPPGAWFTVDGAYRGTTPAAIPLDRGSHAIELNHPGYETHRSTLQVTAGGEKHQATLAASATAAPAPAPTGGPATPAPSATSGEDGGGALLLLLLLGGGAAAILILRKKKQKQPEAPPAHPPLPTPPPPPLPTPAEAPTPRPPAPAGQPEIPPGTTAIIHEQRPGHAYALFRALVAQGTPGLAATRRSPRQVREEAPGADALWLTSQPGENSLRPADLELLLQTAQDHFSKTEGAVLLLEGIEYLGLHRGFTPVLKLATRLQETAAAKHGRLLISLGAGALDPRETALLKGEGRALEITAPPAPAPPAEITAGRGYLLLHKTPDTAYRHLHQWAARGRRTLAVARSSPDETRRRHGLTPETRIVWLTTAKGPDQVEPSDLELLHKILRDFLDEGEDRAILLEGVDHLSAVVGLGATRKLLGHLLDACVTRRAALLIPLDPYALEDKKRVLLSRELTPIE